MQVLQQLHEFATPDGAKPFAKVTADDVILINYSTNLLGWFSRLIPALQTDTEVSTAAIHSQCGAVLACNLTPGWSAYAAL
jgi:hypothetical protein